MLTPLLLCAAGMLPQGGSTAPVVINEFVYRDGPQLDDHEMVELYNRSGAAVDIGDWKLVSNNGSMARTWTIPPGTMLPADSFYVMGASQVPDPKQAIMSNWLMNPQPHNLFHNNNAGLILRDDGGTAMDRVHYETNLGIYGSAVLEGEGVWGRNLTSDVFPNSWQRAVDGLDTDSNGNDFVLLAWSPGVTNDPNQRPSGGAPYPYAENFEGQIVETFLAEWGRAVQFVYTIEPLQPSTHNPNRIEESPQGGKAVSFWPDGGANAGNQNMLLTILPKDVVFEAWCYFDAAPETSGHETWSIGFGATGSAFQPPDPAGTLGTTSNGNQGGVSWTYQVTQNDAILYFIDHNDGGWGTRANTPPTIIGQVTIVPGQNDGWQKLRLERSNGMVLGSFGGALGCADGTTFWAPVTSSNPTTLYVGYRESIPNNATARPPTLDDILVKDATSAVSYTGTAIATTAGTPMLGTMGPPTVGHPGWGITVSGLVPSQVTILMMGTSLAATPVDMQLLGGQPGSLLYLGLTPLLGFPLPSDASGDSSLPIRLPCLPQATGASLFWQVFDPDSALSVPLPLGNSNAMETRFGI